MISSYNSGYQTLIIRAANRNDLPALLQLRADSIGAITAGGPVVEYRYEVDDKQYHSERWGLSWVAALLRKRTFTRSEMGV